MSSRRWGKSPRLELHLLWLFRQLEPHQETIEEILVNGITVDVFCYSRGSTSTPPVISRNVRDPASALGLKIEIDHYRTPNLSQAG